MAWTRAPIIMRSCIQKRDLLRPSKTNYLQAASMFWEPDRKSGYNRKSKIKRENIENVKQGLGELKNEFGKWKDEWKHNLKCENFAPEMYIKHNDYHVAYKFDTQKAVDSWTLTQDSDHDEGKSKAEFVLGPNKTGIFRGSLNTDLPKDGIVKNAGYCQIKSPKETASFQRKKNHDWSMYTHLLLRVRGDGRPYHIVMGVDRYFDVNFNDTYQYPLFTRGGPYWQIAKIPFSKFFLGFKGRLQTKQEPLQRDIISWLGITLADSVHGPFHLEIDYVAAMYDENHFEEFAYEMYDNSPAQLY